MIPNGTRFIGIAPEVDLTERGSALLNKRTEPYTIDDIRGYKVFTALLTQSGGDATEYITSATIAPFVIGVTYEIAVNSANADFTNIGAPNNNIDTRFIATGTTPNSWGDGGYVEIAYNTGAPVVTVLENTIGNIWFSYVDIGYYFFNSNGVFTENKTVAFITPNYSNDYNIIGIGYGDITFGRIKTINPGDLTQGQDSLLNNTPIEIRVYN